MTRVRHLSHEGTPVIHLDLSNLRPGEFGPVFAAFQTQELTV